MSSQPLSGPGPRGDVLPSRHEDGFGRILGTSGRMLDLYSVLAEIGAARDAVLIVGDSGTGKELVARTLHEMSSRPGGRFVAFPCTAIPEPLMESELLGQEDGALTGAEADGEQGAGCLEIAFGGTLFLDELSAVPIAIQRKLLGALKERTFRRLGGKRDIEIDLRVIAATVSEPEVSLLEGRLHEDLLRELDAFVLHIPPLQERSEDIPLLARQFVRDISLENGKRVQGIEPEAMAALTRYSWPGNVRELWSVLERAVRYEERGWLQGTSLPPLGPSEGNELGEAETLEGVKEGEPIAEVGMTVEDVTRRLILKTLEATNFNRTKAAEILGISSKTVYNKLKQWNVQGPSTGGAGLEREGGDGEPSSSGHHPADSRARLP